MKQNIQKVLCPTDFSDAANNAVECAARLAKQWNASLTLWNMHELPFLDEAASRSGLPSRIASKQEALLQTMQDWCEEIRSEFGISCGYFLAPAMNSLKDTMKHYTNGENFDLIVAGTNGADNLYQYYFGTNSYHIIQQAKCPVLIVPEGATCKTVASIVFATDYDRQDADTIEKLLNTFDARITMLHISRQDRPTSKEVYRTFVATTDDRFEQNQRLQFRQAINKSTVDGLQIYIGENDPDWIVLSNKHRNLLEKMLHRSFTRELIDTIGKPVLVFHTGLNKDL